MTPEQKAILLSSANSTVAKELNALSSNIFLFNVQQGWYSDPSTGKRIERNIGEMLMLIVSEIAEGMEGVRKNLNDTHLPDRPMIEVELADAIIRIFDLAGYLNLDLGGAFTEKFKYNANRLDHKIDTRKDVGGKAF